jgi:polyphosphate kinase
MDATGTFSIARREIRCDVPTPERLRELLAVPLPLGLHAGAVERRFFRDVYLDTADSRLREHGVTCRFRASDDDRRRLTVHIDDPLLPAESDVAAARRYDAEVLELDALRAAASDCEPARRLRALADPAQLRPTIVVTTERVLRRTIPRWFRRSQFDFVYDFASVEYGALSRAFQELRVWRLRNGSPTLARVAEALERSHGVRPALVDPFERIRSVASSMAREAERRAIDTGRSVGIVAIADDRIACLLTDGALTLPIADGSGEGACRHLLTTYFGSAVGDLRMIGTVPGGRRDSLLEVWTASQIRRGRDSGRMSAVVWLTPNDLEDHLERPDLLDAPTRAALALVTGAGFLSLGNGRHTAPRSDVVNTGEFAEDGNGDDSERHLDGERSILEFNARVLAMAEDSTTPLLERFRYLAIVSANLDEFFAVQLGALKRRARTMNGGTAASAPRLDARFAGIRAHVEALVARQQSCLAECRSALAAHGVAILPWAELEVSERATLRRHFRSVIMPALTPQAMTEAPGFPTPHVSTLDLFFIVMLKDPATGPLHLACLRIPSSLARFISVRNGAALVLVEDLIRDQLDVVYRGRDVLEAYLFRVTRGAELDVDEADAGNLLQAIEEDAKRRRGNAVVRVEVEGAMPASRRTTLLAELRADRSSEPLPLDATDLYEINGLLDLTALRDIASLPRPELRFPPFRGGEPFPATTSLFALIAERDRLVHHPYDDFGASVQRFLNDAADDDAVTTIKMTLYRAGERSPIVEALLRAARAGKEVVAFVELKARFDEERNVAWAKRLSDAGVHVVHGLVGLKNHAKLALVARREADSLRRYVHVGTGNYHAVTAGLYTDVGLFSADEELASNIGDLFNELTSSSHWPQAVYKRILVAPHGMLTSLIAKIERETANARAGRDARIRLKLNGLTDLDLIAALYRASQAGVTIEAIVRGICRLRPGVRGMSERIRIVSLVGRFLEHARIYAFANAGDPEYFIGSADWRSRNLRRRVEVVVPVTDPACRARLETILDRELHDPAAWRLESDGSYRRSTESRVAGAESQWSFIADAQRGELTANP